MNNRNMATIAPRFLEMQSVIVGATIQNAFRYKTLAPRAFAKDFSAYVLKAQDFHIELRRVPSQLFFALLLWTLKTLNYAVRRLLVNIKFIVALLNLICML